MGVAFLFPGQGAQIPGMLHGLPKHPAVTRTLDEISDSLQADVRQLDTAEALRSTVPVQLSLLACGVAVARALEEEGVRPLAVAGLSAGAFSAAVAAGVLNLPDAVRLVKLRARMMAELYPRGYGLAVIVGLDEAQVSNLVQHAYSAQAPVYISDINAPRQIVISGADEALQKVLASARLIGARKAERLDVAVPSHCPLLDPVADALHASLKGMHLHPPRCVYAGNMSGRALRSAEAVAADLAGNIAHGVRWYEATTVLNELGCGLFLEMPPGHILSKLAHEAFPNVRALAVGEASLQDALRLAGQEPQST
jgi:malonate decarboxylase epsilon subunit